jgi:hypothetical protein
MSDVFRVNLRESTTLSLPPGEVLTVVASNTVSEAGAGLITRLGDSAGAPDQGETAIAKGETKTFGRYAGTTRFKVACDTGYLTYSSAVPAPATQADLAKLSEIASSAIEIDAAIDSSDAVLFANLPAVPTEGMRRPVTDSTTATWGETITGGGANHVLAYFDGANWTVAAK